MKKSIVFAVALCAILLSFASGAVAQEQSSREMVQGDPIPEFILKSSKYGEISSADLNGKVVLITFFATWCGPCQQELAAVQEKLWPEFKDENGFRLVVVGREHTDEQLEEYNQIKKFTFPLYPDPKREVYSKFADITIPRAYLFGKDGKLIHTSKGYDAEEFGDLMKLIRKEL